MSNTLPKLRGKIVEKYGSINNFCKIAGLSVNTVYAKILGERTLTKNDIETWSKFLEIAPSEYHSYYF